MNNINTKSYWNNRFASGNWEDKKGRIQTQQFAISQISLLNIPNNFSGTILDFGCGLGDAFPMYREAYPDAKLLGIDISDEAIKKCKKDYGHIGDFMCGDYNDVPKVDIIIASNVFEHLSDDRTIAKHLLEKCTQLNIIVPYKERLVMGSEHINSYDEDYFSELNKFLCSYKVFKCKRFTQFGFKELYYNIYFKNLLRPLIKKPKLYFKIE
jgi:cyclopropane fatty-acyl-phospholipid synthase-like methyltransferase